MPNPDFYQLRLMDKALEASYSLWNALLTINAIMLTAFSVFAMVVPAANKAIALLLVVCCLVSVFLLVLNYLRVQRRYQSIGEQYTKGVLPDEVEREAEVAAAADEFVAVRHRQQWALWLLLVEAALVAALLIGACR